MFVVIPIKSKCGGEFEAHIEAHLGTTGGYSAEKCPDCDERFNLPAKPVRPLIRK